MIKAVIGGAEPALLLGLSGENIARLMAKEPIRFNLSQVGLPPLTVIIVAGKTEESIVEDLRAAGLDVPEGATS